MRCFGLVPGWAISTSLPSRDNLAGLVGAEDDDPVPHVLPSEPGDVAAPEPGVEQEIEGEPLARADAPSGLEAGDLLSSRWRCGCPLVQSGNGG